MSDVSGFGGELIGKLFPNGNVVRGNTYPITLSMTDAGLPRDVTDYELLVSFSTSLAQTDLDIPLLEKVIPVVGDPLNGEFSGFIEDDETFGLEAGSIYVSVKYINPAGQAYIYDITKMKVDNGVNPRRD